MTVQTSIIIRTLNEADHIERLIKWINKQRYTDWEIVLVDSGSTDGTVEIAQDYISNIQYIAKQDFTFGRSLNIGCRNAAGDYLVLVSAHVYPTDTEWLGNLIRPLDQDSDIGMVYGRQLGRSHISEDRHVDVYFGDKSKIFIDEPAGNNANAAIRRDLWLQQPYDESLPGLEDLDWARKIQSQGYRVYYASDSIVYHVHDESFARIYNRYRREAIAYAQMFGPLQRSWLGFIPRYVISVFRDIHYGICRKESLTRLLRVPATRLAFYLGIYKGGRAPKGSKSNLSKGSSV